MPSLRERRQNFLVCNKIQINTLKHKADILFYTELVQETSDIHDHSKNLNILITYHQQKYYAYILPFLK